MSKPISKKIIQISLLVGTIASLFFVPWLLVKTWIRTLPNTVQEQMDQAIDQGFEGMVVYIDQNGQPPQYLASGWDNRDNKIPAKPHALFKIASISKLYDAVAVTKLIAQGRLDLDKTLADYLPELEEWIENSHKINLRHLLQHKSGIPNFTDTHNFWAAPTNTFEESISLILNKPANFEPGEDYEYCNTNYLLINKIMDDALGYENFHFIQKEILQPLHLTHTYASVNDVDLKNLMSGYHMGYPNDLKEDDLGMVATAEDVGIFVRALNDGTVFSEKEKEIYSTLYEYKHAGWVPGYQSFAEYYEDMDAVIVTFYSTTDADLIYWNLSEIINSRIVKILKK